MVVDSHRTKGATDQSSIKTFIPRKDISSALIREAYCGGLEVYCRICGVALQENAYFCFACGARVRPQERTVVEEFQVTGRELVRKVEELIQEGNIRRIMIKQNGRVLLDIPLAVAIVGVVLAPVLAAVGALAAIVTNCTISVERVER